MADSSLLFCVTDREVHEALVSAKQQFGVPALLMLARKRGIFLSDEDDRDDLADKISILPFGFYELGVIQAEFERAGTGVKTTSFRIPTVLTLAEIKTITEQYTAIATAEGDSVASYPKGETGFALDLRYQEVDLARTRLRQRQTREAHIEFTEVGGETVVILPATPKAQRVADSLAEKLSALRQQPLTPERIDLSSVPDQALRSSFFTRLIVEIEGFTLDNVTRVHVDLHKSSQALPETPEDLEAEDAAKETASATMLGVVNAVALKGDSLTTSVDYQQLQARGFFTTSIQWSARRTAPPSNIVIFEAAFDEPETCTGFRYSAKAWQKQRDTGEHNKTAAAIPDYERRLFQNALEKAAFKVQKAIKEEFAAKSVATPGVAL